MKLFERLGSLLAPFKKTIKTLAIIAGALVILLLLAQTTRLALIIDRLGGQGVEAGASLENMRQSVLMLARDVNRMRGLMNMSEADYPVLKTNEKIPNSENEADSAENQAFFTGLAYLSIKGNKAYTLEYFAKVRANQEVKNFAERNKLRLVAETEGGFRLQQGDSALFRLIPEATSGKPWLAKADGSGLALESTDIQTLIDYLTSALPEALAYQNELAKLIPVLRKAEELPGVQDFLSQKLVSFSESLETSSTFERELRRRDRSVAGRLVLDRKTLSFRLGEIKYANVGELKQKLANDLATLDTKAANDHLVDSNRKHLAEIFKDPAFISLAGDKKFKLSPTEREDNDYYYRDLVLEDGKRLGSFAVQKWTGAVWLMDPNDIPLSTLDGADLSEAIGQKKN